MSQSANQGTGATLDVDDVFSTFVYDGTGSAQTITNDINLSGEGGLVWSKARDQAYVHGWYDTERGISKYLNSASASGQQLNFSTEGLNAFNSNGFTLGTNNDGSNVINASGTEYCTWTFRQAPKFFDMVKVTTSSGTNTISHSLGQTPGMIISKATGFSNLWYVWHRSNSTGNLVLNSSNGTSFFTGAIFGNGISEVVQPTSTEFTFYSAGGEHIFYIFAHHNNDGEFGPNQDQDIIKCDSYTGNGSSTGPSVNLGFEPQWVMVKNLDTNGYGWIISDAMRGFNVTDTVNLEANSSDSETTADIGHWAEPTSTGFKLVSNSVSSNANGTNYIYMAIRRGPLAAPTSASQVFNTNPAVGASGNLGQHRSGFPVDFALQKVTNTTSDWTAGARLIQNKSLRPNDTNQQSDATSFKFDYMDGWGTSSADSDRTAWMWKRAPKYFDVVAYDGSSSNATYNHNLGIAPEMMWVKVTDGTTGYWAVGSNYLSNGTGWDKELRLNEATPEAATSKFDNASSGGTATAPTATQFTVRPGTGDVNDSGKTHIAFLFASISGICKIGSYTGNGSTQTIDCGFSNGSKLVIVKRISTGANGNWVIMDSVRGINAGDDPTLSINVTNPNDPFDLINPQNSGFEVEEHSGSSVHKINTNGVTYLFYAIAA